jgi:hypothetical protein
MMGATFGRFWRESSQKYVNIVLKFGEMVRWYGRVGELSVREPMIT